MPGYYYTLASLPVLRLFESPGITMEEFFSRCSMEVHPHDIEVLSRLRDDDPGVFSLRPELSSWKSYADALDHAVAYQRAERVGRPHERDPGRKDLRDTAKHLVSLASPLEAEREYLRLVWEHAEELEGSLVFDFSILVLYLLKLKLLCRLELFTRERGEDAFSRIFSQLQSRMERTS